MESVETENNFDAALYTIQIGLDSIKNIYDEMRDIKPLLVENPFTLIDTQNNILPAEVSVYRGGMFKTIDEPIMALFNFLRKSNIVNILVDSAFGIVLILELKPEEQTPYYGFNGESVYDFVNKNPSSDFNFNKALTFSNETSTLLTSIKCVPLSVTNLIFNFRSLKVSKKSRTVYPLNQSIITA